MLTLMNNEVDRKRIEIDLLRMEVLEDRLNKSKESIIRLKEAMSTIKNNDRLKKRFEDRIVEKSEHALEILFKFKDFRKKLDQKRAS